MKDFLEQLWFGKIDAPIVEIRKSAAYRDLAYSHIKAVGELDDLLSEDLRKKFHLVIDTHDLLSAYCEKEAFKYGLQLGITNG